MKTSRTGGLALALVGVLALAACGDDPAAAPADDVHSAPATAAAVDHAEIEEFARIRIPDSASELRSSSASAIDTSLYLSFAMDGAELDAFVRDAGFQSPPEPGVRALQVGAGRELGWDTDAVSEFLGHAEEVDGLVREVLVDLDAPDRPVIYLHAYTL